MYALILAETGMVLFFFCSKLAEESEKNMDAVTPPLFLRFINLLMNDAVFLLDEALSNMAKLKEMQAARLYRMVESIMIKQCKTITEKTVNGITFQLQNEHKT